MCAEAWLEAPFDVDEDGSAEVVAPLLEFLAPLLSVLDFASRASSVFGGVVGEGVMVTSAAEGE